MKKSGKKMLAQTERRLSNLGVKEAGICSSGTVANEAQIGDSGFLSYRHEGAERGTMYKPEGVEDPYLNKFGS